MVPSTRPPSMRYDMPASVRALTMIAVVSGLTLQSLAQDDPHSETRSGRTMKPVITGRQYAVTSMKHQATEAAVRILEKGGNAFDAAVAGQAVLALVDQRGRARAQAGDNRVVPAAQRREAPGQRRPSLGHRSWRGGRLVHHARSLG